MTQLFRIVDIQVGPQNNECMNRYWFDNPGETTLTSEDVATGFIYQLMDPVRLVQSSLWDHQGVFVEDVQQPSNNTLATVILGNGVLGGDVTPASNAWSYAMKPSGPIITRGGKRIPGVTEGWTDNEMVLAGVPAEAVSILGGFFKGFLTIGETPIYPCIVRPESPVNPTAWLVSYVVGAIYRQIGTQVTRKLSRGGGTSLGSLVAYNLVEVEAPDRDGFAEIDIVDELELKLADLGVTTLYEGIRSNPL